MLSFLNPLRELTFGSVALRMLLSCVLGAMIGLERSAKNRPAGFRTHTLVCMAASVAALTGIFLADGLHLPADVSRIGGQIITGLGFIGAGTIIITKKQTIKGLTTAAGLWTTGIVGLAIGSGYFEIGVLGAALVLLAETWLGRIGSHIQKQPEFTIEILYHDKEALDQVMRYCKDKHMSVTNLQIHSLDRQAEADYAAELSLRGSEKTNAIVHHIQLMPGVVSALDIEK